MSRVSLLLLAILAIAAPAQAQWRPNATGAPRDSRPDALAVHGLAVIAIDGGGRVLASVNGGISAVGSQNAIPFQVQQVATGSGVFYATTISRNASQPGTGIYRSADGGATWTLISDALAAAFGTATFSILGLGADGPAVYASVDDGVGVPSTRALFRSLDGGATWTRVALQPGFTGFLRLLRQNGALYVFATFGQVRSLRRSLDDGATWTDVTPAPLQSSSSSTALDLYAASNAATGALYAGGRLRYPPSTPSYDGHPLFRSLDGGTTWTRLYTPLEGPEGPRALGPVRVRSLAVIGTTLAVTVVSATSEPQQVESGLWLSDDDGRTWYRPLRPNTGVRYDYASQVTGGVVVNVGGLIYANGGAAVLAAVVPAPDPFALMTTTADLDVTLAGVHVRANRLLTSSTPGRDSLFVRRNVRGNAPPTGTPDVFSGTAGPPFPPFPSMMADTWSVTLNGQGARAYFTRANPVFEFPFDPATAPNPSALVLLRRLGSGWLSVSSTFASTVAVGNGVVRYTPGQPFVPGDYTLGSTDPANTFGGATAGEADAPAVGLGLRLVGTNPVRGAARFAIAPGAGPATLVVYDALGREVSRQDVAAGEAEVGRLVPGVYLARLLAGSRTATRRFTVVR